MTKQEIDYHLENYQDIDIDAMRESGMFSEAQLKNMKLCNIWGKISPVIGYLVDHWLVRLIAKWKGWIIAIKGAQTFLDSECDISK